MTAPASPASRFIETTIRREALRELIEPDGTDWPCYRTPVAYAVDGSPILAAVADPGMRALLAALHGAGCHLLAFGDGHRHWPPQPPFVNFVASVAFAGALHRRLQRDLAERAQPARYWGTPPRHVWQVRGAFAEDGQLFFHLHSAGMAQTYYWTEAGRAQIAADCSTLAAWCWELERMQDQAAPAADGVSP